MMRVRQTDLVLKGYPRSPRCARARDRQQPPATPRQGPTSDQVHPATSTSRADAAASGGQRRREPAQMRRARESIRTCQVLRYENHCVVELSAAVGSRTPVPPDLAVVAATTSKQATARENL